MMEAPAAASSCDGTPLTAPSVPTGMNAGVSTTPCGVESRPRRAAPQVETTSKFRATDASGLRLRFAEVDHPRLDSLRELEHVAVLGDAAVPLEVLEAVLHGVAIGLDVAQAHGEERGVVDPQGHALEALRDPLEAGSQLQAVRLPLGARGGELRIEVLQERLHVAARAEVLENLVRVAADLDQVGPLEVVVPGRH